MVQLWYNFRLLKIINFSFIYIETVEQPLVKYERPVVTYQLH